MFKTIFVSVCLLASAIADNAEQVSSGEFCQYCEMGVGMLESLLKNEESTIANDIKALCDKLPGEEGQICAGVVGDYLPVVINKILGLLNPDRVCTGIHLCSSSGPKSLSLIEMKKLGVDWKPVECNFCKMAFGFVQSSFLSQDFQQALLVDMLKACAAVGSEKFTQECKQVLGSYGEMVLSYLKMLISPDHICPMVKACPSS